MESARVIAGLTRIVRDVGIAEELAQDALVAALEQWPDSGIPQNPGAWLMAAAKHRAIDLLRRNTRLERKHEELARELEEQQQRSFADFATALAAAADGDIQDDLLRLVFISCHPVLSPESRVALTLRLLGGLTTPEIARAFLTPEPTIAQRIVRAKRTLAEAHVPFEVPTGLDRAARLSSVLEVIYLIFNEGYSATAGEDWLRPALCEDALRLGRILAGLAPQEPEVHGLVALMEIQASRHAARLGPAGEPILLLDQDRSRWDQLAIRRGLAALERAEQLNAKMNGGPGPYTLQAAIAACHARARIGEETDWQRIAALYATLAAAPAVAHRRAQPRRRTRHGLRPRRLVLSWSTDSPPSPRSPTTIACPACAASCSSASAGSTKLAPSSSVPPRSHATPASAICCSAAHALVHPQLQASRPLSSLEPDAVAAHHDLARGSRRSCLPPRNRPRNRRMRPTPAFASARPCCSKAARSLPQPMSKTPPTVSPSARNAPQSSAPSRNTAPNCASRRSPSPTSTTQPAHLVAPAARCSAEFMPPNGLVLFPFDGTPETRIQTHTLAELFPLGFNLTHAE